MSSEKKKGKTITRRRVWLKRCLTGFAGLAALFILALALTQTAWFREKLRRELEQRLPAVIGGNLTISRLEGSFFASLKIGGLRYENKGHSIAFQNLELKFYPQLLFHDGVQIGADIRLASLNNLRLHAKLDEEGQLYPPPDFPLLTSVSTEASVPKPKITPNYPLLILQNVTVGNAVVDLELHDGRKVFLRSDLHLGGTSSPKDAFVELNALRLQSRIDGLADGEVNAKGRVELVGLDRNFPETTGGLDVELIYGDSSLTLNFNAEDKDSFRLLLRDTVVYPGDLKTLTQDAPLLSPLHLSGNALLRRTTPVFANLEAKSERTDLKLDIEKGLKGGYDGTLHLSRFDSRDFLPPELISAGGQVRAEFVLRENLVEPVKVSLTTILDRLDYREAKFSTVKGDFRYSENEGAEGLIDMEGTSGKMKVGLLSPKITRTSHPVSMNLQIEKLKINDLVPELGEDILLYSDLDASVENPTQIDSLKGNLAGSFFFEGMEALKPEPFDLRLELKEQNMRLKLKREASDGNLNLKADARLGHDPDLQVEVSLHVDDLGRWARLTGKDLEGSVNLDMTLSGTPSKLSVETQSSLKNFRINDLVIPGATMEGKNFILSREPYVRGSFEISVPEIRGLAALNSLHLGILPDSGSNFSHVLELKLRTPAGEQYLKADIETRTSSVMMDFVEVQLPLGSLWTLGRHETFVIHSTGVGQGMVELLSEGSYFEAGGRLTTRGKQDFQLRLSGLNLELMPFEVPLISSMPGLLNLNAAVRGTAAEPDIKADLSITKAGERKVGFSSLTSSITIEKGEFYSILQAMQGQREVLAVETRIPVSLAWDGEGKTASGGEMLTKLDIRNLEIGEFQEIFTALDFPSSGKLEVDVSVKGTTDNPRIDGKAKLHNGESMVKALGIHFHHIHADVTLSSNSIHLTSLEAKAKEGKLKGGVVVVKEKKTRLEARLALDKWPLIDTAKMKATGRGNLMLHGSLDFLEATGEFAVLQGDLSPQINLPGEAPLDPDPTIVLAGEEDAVGGAVEKDGPDIWGNMKVDLRLRLMPGVFIRHENGFAEIGGDLRARKKPGDVIRLTGQAGTRRGWIALHGRRFEINRGQLDFTGGTPPNPLLDIQTQTRLPGYEVYANIGGSSTEPKIELSSSPPLDTADILSLLLFGKPVSRLGEGEQKSLEQSSQEFAENFAAGQAADLLSKKLGLEEHGIRLSDVTAEGARVGVGRYVNPRTYISVSEALGETEGGQEVSVEYSINREWKAVFQKMTEGASGADLFWEKRY